MNAVILLLALFNPAKGLPQGATVYEDSYGVPSIEAKNIVDAMFALGYAEAKDHAQRMATNYKLARGRLAEINGKSSLLQDGFIRGLGLESKAIELAPQLAGESKDVVTAFLAGANRSLAEQNGTLPKWVEPFSAIDVLSFSEFINAAFPLLDLSAKISPGAGSNQFALAPSKTSTRHPILSIDPHLGWDGQDGGIVWQEFAIYSPDIRFRGVTVPGLPIGVLGHNDRVAWSMTNNNPLLYTIYTVKTNPENRNQYSYHGDWKEFKTEKMEMRYLDNGELKTNTVNSKATEWGPIIPFSNRSVRLSTVNPLVSIQQGLRMLRAKSCSEFRDALKMRAISMWNFVYADVAGNIGYQYNATVPKRDTSIDWEKPVAGEDPKSKWGELWNLDQLPHAENPSSGILVNCNSSPNLSTLGSEIKGDWPEDVTSYGPTTRWEMLSKLLTTSKRVSPDQAKLIATDCTVPYADATVTQLSRFAESSGALSVLKKWDRKGSIDSVGCVLYTYWLRDRKENVILSTAAGKGHTWSLEEGAATQASLASASQKMIAEQGSLTVPWGTVQYMQRGTLKSPVQGFGGSMRN